MFTTNVKKREVETTKNMKVSFKKKIRTHGYVYHIEMTSRLDLGDEYISKK